MLTDSFPGRQRINRRYLWQGLAAAIARQAYLCSHVFLLDHAAPTHYDYCCIMPADVL
jgi:hypothetical protein